MRFMYIVTSPHPGPPTPELLEAMHKLADREIKAGRMLDNGGLMPLVTGAQVRIADGKLSVVDGPFVEAKEVIGGYWFILAGSLEEAADIAAENPCLACGLFCEIRPIDPERASAFTVTVETPREHRG